MAYTGPFPFKVQQGGTGEITLAANAILIGENSSDIAVTNVGTDGQVIVAATGNKPQFATLTSTGGTITYTVGANTLNLESSGTGTAAAVTFLALSGSGGNIPIGTMVYVNGISGGVTVVRPADCVGTSPGNWPAVGITIDVVQPAVAGRVLVSGVASGVDTTTFSIGQRLFLSATSGALTNTRPTGVNVVIQPVGIALTGGTASGKVLLNVPDNVVLLPNLDSNFIPVGLTGATKYPTSVALANGVLTYNTTTQVFTGSSLTQNSLLYGGASNAISSLGVATNGQIPIGSTGTTPVLATITAGSGISVTNAAGSITIAATGGSGFTWTEVTGTSQAMAVNNGYIANNAGLVTLTLPATAAVGDVVRVTGKGAGGWLIAQNSGQTIYFGTSTTTPGVGGSLASTQRRDGVELVCVTANNDWNVLSAQGNLTVV